MTTGAAPVGSASVVHVSAASGPGPVQTVGMELALGLVDAPAFEKAADAEFSVVRSLMPPSPVRPLLVARQADVAQWAVRQVAGAFRPVPQQTVTVRKQRHGVRPVAELFLRDQLLFRVLTEALSGYLVPPSRQTQGFDDFRRAPLAEASAAYVVSSDVSSFYQYIDHNVLAQELLIRTGDAGRVTALMDLMEGVAGRTYGLPQQSEPSDLLAESYIDIVHRRLTRRGLRVWRYNDDWRIAAGSWSEALLAVDLLEHECRRVGLTLNDSKTVIRARATYEEDLSHRESVLGEIAKEAELDLTDFFLMGNYEAIVIEPEQAAVQLEASRKILLRYSEHRDDDENDPKVLQTLLQLVPGALVSLSEAVRAGNSDVEPTILDLCVELLRTEQNLTPQVSRYLSASIDADEAVSLAAFDGLLDVNPYITPWQASWLGPELGRAQQFASGSGGEARGDWLLSVWNDIAASEPVRSGLAVTLARHKLISKGDLLVAYDAVSETGRPGVAAALGVAEPNKADAAVAAMCREDDLSDMAYDWGAALA